MEPTIELPAIDRIVASHLAGSDSKNGFLFIAYLLASARAGHLCSVLEEENIKEMLPLVWESENWNDEKGAFFSKQILLEKNRLQEGILGDTPNSPIQPFQNRFYLRRCWEEETKVLNGLLSLLSFTPHILIDRKKALCLLDELENARKLEKKQKEGILSSLENSLSLLLGGPGTGKTYTAGIFLKIFWESLVEGKEDLRIAMAAPTGKAAARLQKSFVEKTSELEGFPQIQATTLHTLLKGSADPCFCLDYDILLIDESSMIDADIFGRLLSSVKKGARLILLGDPNQLPPVGSGQLFKEIADILVKDPSHKQKVVELDKCQRTDLKAILNFAESVKNGKIDFSLCQDDGVHVRFLPEDIKDSSLKNALFEKEKEGNYLLTPLRKGALGVDALNAAFRDRMFSFESPPFSLPIMIKENQPSLELFNGETGILVQKDRYPKENDLAHFLFPTKRTLPFSLLPCYEYAFALSVHKSQGSEFEKVLLLLPNGAHIFGREMLYTGITRAKKSLEIWCRKSTFIKTIHKSSCRTSSLKERYERRIIS